MKIPFSPPYIDEAVEAEVLDTLRSGWITTGPKVKALEEEVVKMTGSQAAIGVNSWTSGAILLLKWFGVKEGDEVIVPAYTYSATALCVLHCGAIPIMVDIRDDFTIDPEKVRQAITERTKVIIPVDIAGWPCDYDALKAIVEEEGIKRIFTPASDKQKKLGRILIISDAAHSLGAKYGGQAAAKACDITIFSFHAVKNVTSAEGGCICLNLPQAFDSQEEYQYIRMYTLNGQSKDALAKSKAGAGSWRYDILFQGLKVNLPDLNAALALAQIRQYNETLHPARKKIAYKYCEGFSPSSWFVAPPLQDSLRESSYHLFPLRINGLSEAERDQIIDLLMNKGIAVNVHFIPMPMLTLFKQLGYKMETYPNAYKQYACEISLPIYPQLEERQIDFIVESVNIAVEEVLMKNEDV